MSCILVCLGNPGIQYKDTPHNVGFKFADLLYSKYGLCKSESKDVITYLVRISDVNLKVMKPMTYMNLSGAPLRQLKDQSITLFCDEVELKIGKIRYSSSPYKGSHNGIKSVQATIPQFSFIRIGVGSESSLTRKDYVLSAMNEDNLKSINQVIVKMVNKISYFTKDPSQFCSIVSGKQP